MSVVAGYIVPNKPQPLLAPEQNAGWGELRRAYEEAARRIKELNGGA